MNFEEELLQDEQRDAAVVAFIQERLPEEVKNKFSEDDLYYLLDVTETFLAESETDAEGFIDVSIEAVAEMLAATAKKEGQGDFDTEALSEFVDCFLDWAETHEE